MSLVLFFNIKLCSVCPFLINRFVEGIWCLILPQPCNIRVLFLMPQHAVDIPSTPKVSPPSDSSALLCQAPLAARARNRLSCSVVWSQPPCSLPPALPAHSTIMPASAGRGLIRFVQLGGVGEAGSPLKEKYWDKLMRSCYEALSRGENCVAPGSWLFEVQISKLL